MGLFDLDYGCLERVLGSVEWEVGKCNVKKGEIYMEIFKDKIRIFL